MAARDGDFEPEFVHFDVEEELVAMAKRDVGAELAAGDRIDARAYTRYALNTKTSELKNRGTDATLSMDSSEGRRK